MRLKQAIPVIMATMGDPRAGALAEGLRVRLVRREGVRTADFRTDGVTHPARRVAWLAELRAVVSRHA
jgi:hypothetical protein